MIVDHVRWHAAPAGPARGAEQTWFRRIDARAKLVGAFAFVIACSFLTDRVPLVLALSISVALAVASMVPRIRLLKAYAAALPFIALASLSVFLARGTDDGLNMLVRTSACVIPLLVVAAGTEAFDLFAGLRRLKVPGAITTLLMLTYRYILLMSDELSRMSVARKARGFSGGRSLRDAYGLRVISSTAGMVFVRSSGRAERVYEALRIRGFDEDMTAWRNSRLSATGAAFMGCLVGTAIALLVLQAGVLP